ncbi:uncharacterized protein LOC106473888 [Limulus polyphemus]|uniref:Uncharacterized protein LOC106473888 n=1 Tax=Limulus polyphemus TaxID=6850 RepID=A0ABM1TQ34_LIMPO|nr:uncharacterized protein LOC106473888 [Limulus polyphemus]
MSAIKKTGNVIYVLSIITDLGKEITKLLPRDVEVKTVIPVSQQEKSSKLWEVILTNDVIKQLEGAELLVADSFMLRQFMYDIPSLKWVQCTWAGMERLIQYIDPLKPEPPFVITRYADMNAGKSMAEYVIGQIINNERKFYHKWESQKKMYGIFITMSIVCWMNLPLEYLELEIWDQQSAKFPEDTLTTLKLPVCMLSQLPG